MNGSPLSFGTRPNITTGRSFNRYIYLALLEIYLPVMSGEHLTPDYVTSSLRGTLVIFFFAFLKHSLVLRRRYDSYWEMLVTMSFDTQQQIKPTHAVRFIVLVAVETRPLSFEVTCCTTLVQLRPTSYVYHLFRMCCKQFASTRPHETFETYHERART